MKHRYWLFRRNGIYYLQDAQNGHKESLHTSDRSEAQRLRDARDDATQNPNLGFALAKAYLSNRDPQITKRTWQAVFDEFCARGKPQTQERRHRVAASKAFVFLRSRKILETTPQDFFSVLQAGGVMVNTFLRCVQNLALGLGWLPWCVLPPKLWPAPQIKQKRGITADEYGRIIASEKNTQQLLYYQLLWEIGASQSDAASLRAENIDWLNSLLSYQRQKTGEWAYLKIGKRLESLLRQLPTEGFLFPKLANSTAGRRAAEFSRRCRVLKMHGISLHSFRYGFAERASELGYPERYAQAALGHGSRSVHRAYAKRAKVIVPSLESFEQK